ncbi:2-C-methyl-D-erythritol 4-phosphate cytidylyltransferase [endosymbiont of unidentified scaly snail isolate Monju]|uniref:2-C-methyl-D-erythritol 4-phosphate cytidylyltransferase n=1 Tax=endosymbiont of unidentified scaly snail isolate Monju TaxID=1248727 RepID=UPI00038926A2|nr:2-C-methyl-D-erythritol 4-phosphate cytidylyltransferase [endosymbiont of unidentified scaly snail isolate Monju]BAN69229.1 2-C-methyl-D-erythritol 4-phosphate cytidylyltransferase [endosymbiont of unidentified scaly snail isolate Monju]
MSEPRRWAVIPAAGVGRRMGSDIPKQYLPLGGRTVIEHTVERLLLHPGIDGLYIALGEQDAWWEDTEYAMHPDLVRVPGGTERVHSVLNALLALERRAAPDDWVLVHDAARPCVRREEISRLIERVEASDAAGGLLGVPVRDTMKRSGEDDRVRRTVEREHLWHAFTPQMFRLRALREAIEGALAAGVTVTDEASAMEWAGHAALLVEGLASNIKITRPGDLELAAFYLQDGITPH